MRIAWARQAAFLVGLQLLQLSGIACGPQTSDTVGAGDETTGAAEDGNSTSVDAGVTTALDDSTGEVSSGTTTGMIPSPCAWGDPSSGTELWRASFVSAASNPRLSDVLVSPDGFVGVTGKSSGDKLGDGWVAVLDATGTLQWDAVFESPEDDVGLFVLFDGDSLLAAGADTTVADPDVGVNVEIWVTRHTLGGTLDWLVTIPHEVDTNERLVGLNLDQNGDILLLAELPNTDVIPPRFVIRRLSPDGALISTTPIGVRKHKGTAEVAEDVENVGVGAFVVATANGDGRVLQWSSAAQVLWTYNDPEFVPVLEFQVTPFMNGAIAVTSPHPFDERIAPQIIHIDSGGVPKQQHSWGSIADDARALDVVLDHAGDLVIVGKNGVDGDAWVRKYTTSGELIWDIVPRSGGDDVVLSTVSIAPDCHIVAGGRSAFDRGYTEPLVVAFAP